MTDASNPTCATCRYFVPVTTHVAHETSIDEYGKPYRSKTFRHAPSRCQRYPQSEPKVAADWCGEHAPIAAAKSTCKNCMEFRSLKVIQVSKVGTCIDCGRWVCATEHQPTRRVESEKGVSGRLKLRITFNGCQFTYNDLNQNPEFGYIAVESTSHGFTAYEAGCVPNAIPADSEYYSKACLPPCGSWVESRNFQLGTCIKLERL